MTSTELKSAGGGGGTPGDMYTGKVHGEISAYSARQYVTTD